jgi:hypothetical protein
MNITITHSNTPCQGKSSPRESLQSSIPKIGDSGWFPKINKYPVVAYVVIREGKEISARPCNFGGEPIKLASREEIIGIVPAPPGVEAVEYTSAIEIQETVFVRLGYQQPNETTDWEAEAVEREESRLSRVGSGGSGSPRLLSREEFESVSQ